MCYTSGNEYDNELSNETSWNCPVCNIACNSRGEPFVSEWAVACHIAGKVNIGDKLHRSWAINKSFGVDFKDTIPKIAEKLLWAVTEEYRERARAIHFTRPSNVLYERVSTIEVRLHNFIKDVLINEYGSSENEWWIKGIPLTVRKKCADRQEEDDLKQERYAYRDLIDMQSILNSNWRLYEPYLKKVKNECESKKYFLDCLGKLNEIRKVVMHPVRELESLTEETQFLDWFDKLTQEFIS